MKLWLKGIEFVIGELKKQKALSDRRISWLKEKYLYLYFEDLVCCGPTPADAIQTVVYSLGISFPAGAPAQILRQMGFFMPCSHIRSQNCLKGIAIPSCDPSLQDEMSLPEFQ
ncbi:hypothetical protein AVEN_10292-1, partial [Araneus ventricosus]